ncbi:MAG: hypothetical protein ACK55Z_12725 [bacterium]
MLNCLLLLLGEINRLQLRNLRLLSAEQSTEQTSRCRDSCSTQNCRSKSYCHKLSFWFRTIARIHRHLILHRPCVSSRQHRPDTASSAPAQLEPL